MTSMTRMTRFWCLMITLLNCSLANSAVFHHYPELEDNDRKCVWENLSVDPFDELIISWNATRPTNGDFKIDVMLKA